MKEMQSIVRYIFALILLIFFTSCEKDGLVLDSLEPENPIPEQSNLRFKFSHDVVSPTETMILLDTVGITFEPHIEGRFRWLDLKTLQFLPSTPFQAATKYIAHIPAGFSSVTNQPYKGKNEVSFHTRGLFLWSTSHKFTPISGQPGETDIEIVLQFNTMVSPEEIAKYTTLYHHHDKNKEKLEFEVHEGNEENYIVLSSRGVQRSEDIDAVLALEIDQGLPPMFGNLALEESVNRSIKFSGVKELKINHIWAHQRGREFQISINVSNPLDIETLRNYLTIEPEHEIDIVSQYYGTLLITGDFQPKQRLNITLQKGLSSVDGGKLVSTFTQTIHVPDYQPDLEFDSPGKYLARSGLKNVAISAINIDSMLVQVEKIYKNNIVHFLQNDDSFGRRQWYTTESLHFGKRIFEERINIDGDFNKYSTVTFNFDKFIEEHPTGLFKLSIRDGERHYRSDYRTLMVTDIGLIAKQSGKNVHVWAMSTSSLKPLPNVKITLLSRTNQSIGSGVTNSEGYTVIRDFNKSEDDFEPYLLTAEQADDFSYLLYDESKIETSDFDVEGSDFSEDGFTAYIYGDRDIYRPGEKAHIVGVLRNNNTLPPSNFPVLLRIISPRADVIERQKARTVEQGVVEYEWYIPGYTQTGVYRAELLTAGDVIVGSYKFQVEEFIPDRMKVNLSTDKDRYELSKTIQIDVQAEMLFGPPASGRECNAAITLVAQAFTPKDWGAYTFGDKERTFSSEANGLGRVTLDDLGEAKFAYSLPDKLVPPAALKAIIEVTVQERGGRSVSNQIAKDIDAYPVYIGLKKVSEGYAKPGEEFSLNYVFLDSEENAAQLSVVEVTLLKYRWNTVLEKDENEKYRYVSRRTVEEIQTFRQKTSEYRGIIVVIPPSYGSYSVRVKDPISESASTLDFYASGWGYAPWAIENPEQLEIELDKEKYRPGQSASVLLKTPFPGKVLLTVERDELYLQRQFTMDQNSATVQIPILESFSPNAYVTATLIRSPENNDRHSPNRAFGAKPIFLEMEHKKVEISLDAPEKIKPAGKLEIEVKVKNTAGNAVVTVAAVDEGILQLTDYKTPNPFDLFYGKRRLSMSTYDMFSKLLPEVDQAEIHSSPGGGQGARALSHVSGLTISRLKPVALWSGSVPVRGGRAAVSFDVPQFNGRLRVMAVAVSGDHFNRASASVQVEDELILTPTIPRFVAGGDNFTIPVGVYNSTEQPLAVELSVSTEGAVLVTENTSQLVMLEAGKEGIAFFDFSAEDANSVAKLTFTAKTDKSDIVHQENLPVRPPFQPKSKTLSGTIEAGKKATVSLPGGWLDGAASGKMYLTSLPTAKYSAGLEYLLSYPYGCLEQTVSKAFPLLYFDELAEAVFAVMSEESASEYYISEAINKILAMQQNDGSFSFWHGNSTTNSWASIYALHFLAEARDIGFDVPEGKLNRGERFLRKILKVRVQVDENQSRSRSRNRNRGQYSENNESITLQHQCYAAYVLAIMGSPYNAGMNYLYENKLDELASDERALLAGALSLSGDDRAKELLPVQTFPRVFQDGRESGNTFYSQARGNAILLYILARQYPNHPMIPELVSFLNDKLENGRWWTTQENAWALLALGRTFASQVKPAFTGTVSLKGDVLAEFTHEGLTIVDSSLVGEKLSIQLNGQGTCYYYVETRGIPEKHEFVEEYAGIKVTRSYFDQDGGKLNITDIKQGELIVGAITVENISGESIENIVVDDMLPGGLEIENPRLQSRQRLGWMERENSSPDNMDIRDDRLLFFLNLRDNEKTTYYYMARAITKGEFVLPPVMAECMYNPTIFGRSGESVIKVN
ncbi:alpha-2-macroglobulin family protein [bacterium]|nr:alpha-2-macroglobulin family protein [bacterium]